MSCCNVCGTENDDQGRFCAKCGVALERPTMTQSHVSPSAPSVPPSMAMALQFAYVAVDKSQKRVSGTVTAANKRGAILAVERLGLVPVTIVPASAPASHASKYAAIPNPTAEGAVFRFQCPSCLQQLEAAPDMSGDRIVCPKCGKRFNVPSPEQAGGAHVVVPLGAPSATYGWKRRRVAFALAAALLIIIGASVFILPRFLPGAVKRPPPGWVAHDHFPTRSTIYLPAEWKRPSLEEAISRFHMGFEPKTMVWLIKEKKTGGYTSPDQVVQIDFFGFRMSDKLQGKSDLQFLTDEMPKEAELAKEDSKLVSQIIHTVAGCKAAEMVTEKSYMRQRFVMLVAKNPAGARQVVTFACQADKSDFDEVDEKVFSPMIGSFVYFDRHRKDESVDRSRW